MLKRKRSKRLRVFPLVCLLASMMFVYFIWEVEQQEKFAKELANTELATEGPAISVAVSYMPTIVVKAKDKALKNLTAPSPEVDRKQIKPSKILNAPQVKAQKNIRKSVASDNKTQFLTPKNFKKQLVVYDLREVPKIQVGVREENGEVVEAELIETRTSQTRECKETEVIRKLWVYRDATGTEFKKGPAQTIYLVKGIKVEITQAINFNQEIEVTATIRGGNEPFKIKWDNGQVGERASYRSPGYHYVIVEDSKGCGLLQDFMVEPINLIRLGENEMLQEEADSFLSAADKIEIITPGIQDQLKFDAPAFQMGETNLLSGDLMEFVKGSKNKALKFEVLRPSVGGQLKFGYDGKFDYQPNDDFEGRDAFTVSICDDEQCLLGRVEIKVGSTTLSEKDN